MNQNKQAILVTLSFIYVVAFITYWFKLGGDNTIAIRNILYLLTPLTGVCGGLYSLTIFGFTGARARTIILLSVGLLCWFIGEALFSYYEVIAHTDPFPSAADMFYVLAYPFFFLGMLNELKFAKVNLEKLRQETKFLLGIISFMLICLVFYLIIYLGYDSAGSALANGINALYGIGDIILIITNMFILVLSWEFKGGKLSKTWMNIFMAFVFIFVADLLFALYQDQYTDNLYFYRNFIDSLFMLGYIILAYGLFDFGFSSLAIFDKLTPRVLDKRPIIVRKLR